MTKNYQEVSVDKLEFGPIFEFRKLFYDHEIVQLRRSDIATSGKLEQQYAIIVRQIETNKYEVVDGTLRLKLCKELDIVTVPCIVIDLASDESIISFVSANQVNGISKLMIGICALQWNKERGGRGHRSQRGDFCRKLKLDKSNFSRYCQSAMVFLFVFNELTDEEKKKLQGKGNSLWKIKRLPQCDWLKAAKMMAADVQYEVIERTRNLKDYFETVENKEIIKEIIPTEKAMSCAFRNESGKISMQLAINEINKAIAKCREDNRHDDIENFKDYVRENGFRQEGTRNFFDFRGIIRRAREIATPGNESDCNDYIYNEDALSFLDRLKDESASLAIIDGPWGGNKSSISRENQTVPNDTPGYTRELYKTIAPIIFSKMKMDSFIVVFYSPKFILQTLQPFVKNGFELVDSMCWVKSSHTIGGVQGTSPMSKKEGMYLLSKGKPLWLSTLSNVFTYPSVSRTNRVHPTQKPMDLMRDIVISTTTRGDLVIDPFLGSGVSLKVARSLGRKVAGSELSEAFFPLAWNNIFGGDREQAM